MDCIGGWLALCVGACIGGVLSLGATASAQCSDGTVEAILAEGEMVGCAGAWNVPGLVRIDGAAHEPSCGRLSGNDGEFRDVEDMNEAGVRCSAADLCGLGWGLCTEGDVVEGPSCPEGGLDGDAATYAAAVAECGGDAGAQVVGCGTFECPNELSGELCGGFNRQSYGFGEDPCAPLNGSDCEAIDALESSWSCIPAEGRTPPENVTKQTAERGGVLCCFREACDCIDEAGKCYAEGEAAEPCLVCFAGDEPGKPLTVIEECLDGGAPDLDASTGPPQDLGHVEGSEITFRGDGGCECRTTTSGSPSVALLALVLFALRRRT